MLEAESKTAMETSTNSSMENSAGRGTDHAPAAKAGEVDAEPSQNLSIAGEAGSETSDGVVNSGASYAKPDVDVDVVEPAEKASSPSSLVLASDPTVHLKTTFIGELCLCISVKSVLSLK